MKKKTVLAQLNELAKDQREYCETLPQGETQKAAAHKAAALEEAIRQLDTPTDRCLANEILLLLGLVLGAVGAISVLCGVIYVIIGNFAASWAMLPWAIMAAIAALLSFAGVRK